MGGPPGSFFVLFFCSPHANTSSGRLLGHETSQNAVKTEVFRYQQRYWRGDPFGMLGRANFPLLYQTKSEHGSRKRRREREVLTAHRSILEVNQ